MLVLWSLAARAISALIGVTPLRLLDRVFGAVFGVARGVLVLLVVAMLLALTPAAQTAAWRESQGAVWLNAVLHQLAPLLPFPSGLPAGTVPAAHA
ncbi:MAG: CvpA family protein [Caldimonas sp.]